MREIDLELRISQAHERKGKEVFFLDPKASRCIRQLSKSPSSTKRNNCLNHKDDLEIRMK